MSLTRDIVQAFWRDETLPWLELRSTRHSRQAYKRHRHPQLSLGAIIAGETCCQCDGQTYLLQPGDLIVIPANAPHSCNPCEGRPAATICCTSTWRGACNSCRLSRPRRSCMRHNR